MGAVQLISQAEYAKRRGCSQVAVHKAVKAKRITLIEGMIDPIVADMQWQQNTRARASSKPQASAPQDKPEADSDDGYWQSRSRREAAEAEMAELKLSEQRGELVRAADVRSAYSKRAAGLREALLQIPARLAAVLAAETDHARVHDTLQAELHAVLSQVVQA